MPRRPAEPCECCDSGKGQALQKLGVPKVLICKACFKTTTYPLIGERDATRKKGDYEEKKTRFVKFLRAVRKQLSGPDIASFKDKLRQGIAEEMEKAGDRSKVLDNLSRLMNTSTGSLWGSVKAAFDGADDAIDIAQLTRGIEDVWGEFVSGGNVPTQDQPEVQQAPASADAARPEVDGSAQASPEGSGAAGRHAASASAHRSVLPGATHTLSGVSLPEISVPSAMRPLLERPTDSSAQAGQGGNGAQAASANAHHVVKPGGACPPLSCATLITTLPSDFQSLNTSERNAMARRNSEVHNGTGEPSHAPNSSGGESQGEARSRRRPLPAASRATGPASKAARRIASRTASATQEGVSDASDGSNAPAAAWTFPREWTLQPIQLKNLWPTAANESKCVIERPWAVGKLMDKLESAQCVVLLGEAGLGKSLIMRQFCEGQAMAVHYCFRFNRSKILDRRRFVCTLARQLADAVPPYMHKLQADRELQRLFSTEALSQPGGPMQALEEGVLEPLQELASELPSAVYIVVDALDEAADALDEAADAEAFRTLNLLELILDRLERLEQLKLVCSSRPGVKHVQPLLRRVSCSVNLNDCKEEIEEELEKTYLSQRLQQSARLQEKLGALKAGVTDTAARSWQSKVLGAFVRRANLSFQWLAFAVRQIEGDDALNFDSGDSHLPPGLDALYLARIQTQLPVERFQEVRPVLGVLLYSKQQLGTNQVFDACRFCGLSLHEIEVCLKQTLGGYVRCRRGVWVMRHKSVHDWLRSLENAQEYYCAPLEGVKMLLARLSWASGVVQGPDLQALCRLLGLGVPDGSVMEPIPSLLDEQVLGGIISCAASLEKHLGTAADWQWLLGMVMRKLYDEVSQVTDQSARLAAFRCEPSFATQEAVCAGSKPITFALALAWALRPHGLEWPVVHCQVRGSRDWSTLADALMPRRDEDKQPWTCNAAIESIYLSHDERVLSSPIADSSAASGSSNPGRTGSGRIGSSGAIGLANALRPRPNPDGTWAFMSSLTQLSLFQCAIGDNGAEAIAGALSPCRASKDSPWSYQLNLKMLSLEDNGIGPRGGAALASVLCGPDRNPDKSFCFNATLTELTLTKNNIGNEGAKALGKALKARKDSEGQWRHCALRMLLLKYNCIGDAGTVALAEALRPCRDGPEDAWFVNKSLNHLTLKQNDIGDTGAKALAETIRPVLNPDGAWVASPLKVLDLTENVGIGDDSIGRHGKLKEALLARREKRETPRAKWFVKTGVLV